MPSRMASLRGWRGADSLFRGTVRALQQELLPVSVFSRDGPMPMLLARLVSDGATPLLVARALQIATSFVVSVAVVWAHGLEGAGSLALSALPAALGGHMVTLGLQSALPRARMSPRAGATVGLVVSIAMSIAIVPLIVLYAAQLAHSWEEAVAIAALATAGALGGQNNVAQILYVMQGRQIAAPIMPMVYLAGIGVAIVVSGTLSGFALTLLGARVAACVLGFAPIGYERVTPSQIWRTVSESVRFTFLDVAGLLAEQLPIVLLSGILTRAELGVIGLLRQFLTVADTPGFTLVFNNYPKLVDGAEGLLPRLAKQNERLSWFAALGTFCAASMAAVLVYGLPILVAALPVMLLALPSRYIANFCGQAFRAAGMIRQCVWLAAANIAVSIPLFTGLATIWGLWGAVAAFAFQSMVSGLLYRYVFVRRFPGAFRPIRPWRLA